jgi:hypothetical protein
MYPKTIWESDLFLLVTEGETQFWGQDYCGFCFFLGQGKGKSKNYFEGGELAKLPAASRCSTAIDHTIFTSNFEKARRGAISSANWA